MAKRISVQEIAAALGLYVSTWAPGDGITRYRFHESAERANYWLESGVATCLGRSDALVWLEGFKAGKGAAC